ncbi:MAG: hypothetical protein AAGI44_02435 [Pseudomonadota bacterium]
MSPGSSASFASISANSGSAGCSFSAQAEAGGGYAAIVGVAGSTQSNSSIFAEAEWSASVPITGPANYSGGPVEVRVLYALSYLSFISLGSDDVNNGSALIDWLARFDTSVSRGGNTPNAIQLRNRRQVFEMDDVVNQNDGDSSVYATPWFTVTPQDFISLSISIGATVQALHPGALARAEFNANNTASLAVTGAAFEFQSIGGSPVDGFFVNSPENNIFNNSWVDPRDENDDPPRSVPIAASLPLFLCGLAMLAMVGRLRRRAL